MWTYNFMHSHPCDPDTVIETQLNLRKQQGNCFAPPLWRGPRCSQKWIRSYRNLDIRTKTGPKYVRILPLSVQLSSMHIFACWPDCLLLQVGKRLRWAAQSGFHTHQVHVECKDDCSPEEMWVPGRPTLDIHYKCCFSNMPASVLNGLHLWSHLVPKLTRWGRSYRRYLPILQMKKHKTNYTRSFLPAPMLGLGHSENMIQM